MYKINLTGHRESVDLNIVHYNSIKEEYYIPYFSYLLRCHTGMQVNLLTVRGPVISTTVSAKVNQSETRILGLTIGN